MRIRLALPVAVAVATALAAPAVGSPPEGQPSQRGSAPAAQEAVPGELLVGYVAGTSPEQRSRARGRASAALAERVVVAGAGRGEVERVRVPAGKAQDQAIREIESDPAVVYAEPNWVYQHDATSNDPYYTGGSLWGMYGDASSPANQYGSQAAEAWAAGNTGGGSVYIGIIDEGVDYNHPDLNDNIWSNPHDTADGIDNDGNGYVDDVRGWDFDGGNNGVYDGTGDDHGTHVAGTIGAEGGNGVGVAGVAWDVTLIPAKFLGGGGGTTANAIKAVDYLTDLKTRHGLNIVATNNSWGGGGFSQGLYDAIQRAGNQQILFIAAAGNGGRDKVGDNNDVYPHYPSSYSNANVISVASITSTGSRSSFSNYGKTSVDLGAPGSNIYSTLPGNTYGSYGGTSMATPHVTGAVALYAAGHAGATAATTKAAVLGAAVPTTSLNNITVTNGRLNASGFQASSPPPNQPPVAGFTYVCDNLQCNFVNASTDESASTLTYSWSFGDGTGSTAADVLKTYAAGGTYPVTLRATDSAGLSNEHTKSVTVTEPGTAPQNAAPVASFTFSCTYLSCSFTDTSTDDAGITRWSWTADDSWSATTPDASHTFNGPGSYAVTLTVSDAGGLTNASTQTVEVQAPPAIVLSARAYKVKGLQTVDLSWTGANGATVEVWRGSEVRTTTTGSSYTDHLNTKGAGTYTYKVCTTATTGCSNTVTVTF